MNDVQGALSRFLSEATFGGVGILVAIFLVLVLRVLLPAHERARLRLPLGFLLLHIVSIVLLFALPATETVQKPMRLSALFFLLASIGRSGFLLVVDTLVGRRFSRPLPKIFRDILQALVYVGVALVTLRAAGVDPGSLLTTSALLTAVIGLSLQDTLGNMFAGLSIQAEHPFGVGDWIQFNDRDEHVGQVIEINWRATKVLTLDQVVVIIPNGMLAKSPITVFTKPARPARRSVFVTVPYGVPPRRIHRLTMRALKDVDGVLKQPAPTIVTWKFGDRGIEYWLRFFVDEFGARDLIASEVRDHIWYALHREGITMPVSTHVVHLHQASAEDQAREREASILEREDALRCVDFLDALPEDAFHRLASLTQSRLYAPSEVIIHQGDEGNDLFIIQRGEVAILLDRDGDGIADVEVAVLGPGKFFGEMSLMTGEKRTATARAKTECQLLVVAKSSFRQVLDSSPELAERISVILATRQAQLTEHVSAHAADDLAATERSGELLRKIKEFFSL